MQGLVTLDHHRGPGQVWYALVIRGRGITPPVIELAQQTGQIEIVTIETGFIEDNAAQLTHMLFTLGLKQAGVICYYRPGTAARRKPDVGLIVRWPGLAAARIVLILLSRG